MLKVLQLSRLSNVAYILGGSLFFLMLYTPRANIEIKLFFLFPLVLIILIGVIIKKIPLLNQESLIWIFIYILYGALWGFLGILNGNPGFDGYIRLFVYWGFLYAILIIGIHDKSTLILLFKIGIYSIIPISLFNIMLFFNSVGFIPSNIILDIEMGARSGLHAGYSQLTSHNIGSLLFLLPFLFTVLLMDSGKYFSINRPALLIIFTIGFIVAYLSGRRALWLILFMTPFITLIIMLMLNKHKDAVLTLKKIMYVFVAVLMVYLTAKSLLPTLKLWDLEGLIERITSASREGDVRSVQAIALLNSFYDSPIIGHGFGASAHEFIRRVDKPWMYELSYLLILHSTGVIGISIYMGLLLYLLNRIYQICKVDTSASKYGVPLVIGMLSFLIACITNPYLFSFDSMFPIFLGLAFINVFNGNHMLKVYDR